MTQEIETLETEANALVSLSQVTPAMIFVENGCQPFIDKVKQMVDEFEADVTTEKGRAAMKSMARKVASSKTAIDEMGKELVAVLKVQTNAIDAERKRVRDAFDELRDKVKAPAVEWENAEKSRVDNLQNALGLIRSHANAASINDPEHIRNCLLGAKEIFTSTVWQEFSDVAVGAYKNTVNTLEQALADIEAQRKKDLELERLRAEQAEREKADREAKIAADAAEKAAKDATDAANKAAQDAIDEANRKAKEAQDALDAQSAKEKAEEDAQAARDADKAHRAKINNAIVAAIVAAVPSLSADNAKNIVAAILQGQVPNTTIKY
jgi:septal ring factor EnvC (AmiA/AmiB activator)